MVLGFNPRLPIGKSWSNENQPVKLATWNEADKTIKNLTGVIPIPLDWQTALKVDFVAKDASGEWTFQKDSINATQLLFADPIDVKKMPKF